MDIDSKAFSLFWQVYHGNSDFSNIIDEGFKNGKIRFFNDEEWNKINNQNFVSPVSEMKEFRDMFLFGYNVGNCVNTSRQLSYSYHNVDIIDTSLMLVIDKSLKSALGYIEEQRLTSFQLARSRNYQARKEFANDRSLNRNWKK